MQSLANQLNAFIVCLTETHLSNEVFDADIHINCFTPFRCDRSNRKGGGVMIYVKDILTDVVEIFNKSNGTCECIVLHLKSINLITAVFYRPPDTKTNQFLPLLKELKHVLNELHEPTPNILLMGDFNFRFIKWNTNTEHLFCVPRIPDGDRDQYNQAHELIQLCNGLFLLQYVAEGTRNMSTLDLIFTNAQELIHCIDLEGTTQSDHRLITVQTTLQLDKPKRSTPPEENNIFKRLNFYKADWDALNQKLSSIDWNTLLDHLSIEEMYTQFLNVISDTCQQFVSLKKVRVPENLNLNVNVEQNFAEKLN